MENGSGTDRAWAGGVACCGVNNRGVAHAARKGFFIRLTAQAAPGSVAAPALSRFR